MSCLHLFQFLDFQMLSLRPKQNLQSGLEFGKTNHIQNLRYAVWKPSDLTGDFCFVQAGVISSLPGSEIPPAIINCLSPPFPMRVKSSAEASKTPSEVNGAATITLSLALETLWTKIRSDDMRSTDAFIHKWRASPRRDLRLIRRCFVRVSESSISTAFWAFFSLLNLFFALSPGSICFLGPFNSPVLVLDRGELWDVRLEGIE
jgi:hypothetical protein